MYKVAFVFLVLVIVFFLTQGDHRTSVKISTVTHNTKNAGSSGNAYVSFNYDDKLYALDKPSYRDRKRGAKDSYEFIIDYPINHISDITLSLNSHNAWKLKEFTVQFISDDRYSAQYVSNRSMWLSTEEIDQQKSGAVPSYTYSFDMELFDYEKVPTIYLK